MADTFDIDGGGREFSHNILRQGQSLSNHAPAYSGPHPDLVSEDMLRALDDYVASVARLIDELPWG